MVHPLTGDSVQSWRLWLAVVLACPAVATSATGTTLRVCTDIHPHPPYLLPHGGGSANRLVVQAARKAGFKVEFYTVSLARCKAEIAINLVHGFPMTPHQPDALPFVQFPTRNGVLDASRATLRTRIMLFRRVGASAAWDGKRFSALTRPVLVPAGSIAFSEALRAAGAPMDENGKSLEVNLAKMMAGRGDVAAGFEEEGAALMALPEFAGKVEMLPLPLYEQDFYLAVSKPYYRQHRARVEKMWNAMGRLNQAARRLKK
jgi:polar amino acid transport system substrate-binding protein